MATTRVRAHVSKTTKERIESYASAYGLKKGRLIEEALLHHLKALHELPADLIIPPRLVVKQQTLERVAQLVNRPRKPTKALRALMIGKEDL